MSRSCYWSFTLNNYSDEEFGALLTLNSEKWTVVFGKETAPSTGTHHLQGFICSTDEEKRVLRSSVEHALGGRAWLEPTHCPEACIGYSIKDGDFYTNWIEGEELDRMRRVIEKAKEYGSEYRWLGVVWENALDRPEYELCEAYRKCWEWNDGCRKGKGKEKEEEF